MYSNLHNTFNSSKRSKVHMSNSGVKSITDSVDFTHQEPFQCAGKLQEDSVCVGELLLILIVAHTALAKPTIAVTLRSWSFAISISGRKKCARICSGNLFRCHRLVRLTHPSSRAEPSHHTLVRQHMSGVLWDPFHASDRKDRHYWLFTVPLGSVQPLEEGKWGEWEYNIWHKFTFNLCHRTPTCYHKHVPNNLQ